MFWFSCSWSVRSSNYGTSKELKCCSAPWSRYAICPPVYPHVIPVCWMNANRDRKKRILLKARKKNGNETGYYEHWAHRKEWLRQEEEKRRSERDGLFVTIAENLSNGSGLFSPRMLAVCMCVCGRRQSYWNYSFIYEMKWDPAVGMAIKGSKIVTHLLLFPSSLLSSAISSSTAPRFGSHLANDVATIGNNFQHDVSERRNAMAMTIMVWDDLVLTMWSISQRSVNHMMEWNGIWLMAMAGVLLRGPARPIIHDGKFSNVFKMKPDDFYFMCIFNLNDGRDGRDRGSRDRVFAASRCPFGSTWISLAFFSAI